MKYVEINSAELESVLGEIKYDEIMKDAEKLANISEKVLLTTIDLSEKALVGFGKFIMWVIPKIKPFVKKCINKIHGIKRQAKTEIAKAETPAEVERITRKAEKEIKQVQLIFIKKINIIADKNATPEQIADQFNDEELDLFVEEYLS